MQVLLDAGESEAVAARRRWLEWTVASYEQLALLEQPPYGDRAIVSRASGEVVGACGFAPLLGPFGRVVDGISSERYVAEVGLYWAILPTHRRQGFATEAAQALVACGFEMLQVRRLLATTTYDNAASIGVMRKLGMRIVRNSGGEPPWLQVVGVIDGLSGDAGRSAPS